MTKTVYFKKSLVKYPLQSEVSLTVSHLTELLQADSPIPSLKHWRYRLGNFRLTCAQAYMGHQDQDGEKVGKLSLFD